MVNRYARYWSVKGVSCRCSYCLGLARDDEMGANGSPWRAAYMSSITAVASPYRYVTSIQVHLHPYNFDLIA